jgi:hypothetical protein
MKFLFFTLTILLISVSGYSQNQPVSQIKQGIVPAPQTVETGDFLIGAFRCPLWYEKTRPGCWDPIKKYPERTPLLGYYNEADPDFVDWEIKYALEHGISFFFECWFREKNNLGKSPVVDTLDHWLHEGFFNSRYQELMKFCILWENVNGIASGVESEEDLLENLLPYWIENYFSRPNYLRVQNKPLFMIYNYEKFINDLGGEEAAEMAILKMKKACKKAGLNGLYLLAEHHLPFNKDLRFLKDMGFDAITSYHWPSFSGLMPLVPETAGQIIDFQEYCWPKLEEISELPAITTLSVGWNSEPWGSSYYKGQWLLTPDNFRILSEKAKAYCIAAEPNPVSKIVMLDNWNEYGEGHYIFPTRQYGFGYLDAVRNTFSTDDPHHVDLLPEDIGLGPYIYTP